MGALVDSSFNPSCYWKAVNRSGAASGLSGRFVASCWPVKTMLQEAHRVTRQP